MELTKIIKGVWITLGFSTTVTNKRNSLCGPHFSKPFQRTLIVRILICMLIHYITCRGQLLLPSKQPTTKIPCGLQIGASYFAQLKWRCGENAICHLRLTNPQNQKSSPDVFQYPKPRRLVTAAWLIIAALWRVINCTRKVGSNACN